MRLLVGELSLAATLALVAVAAGQESQIEDLDFSIYKTDLLPHPFHSSAKQSPAPWYLQNIDDGDKDCPPCFNCMLPAFECKHFANCSEYDGKCKCPPGFGGDDCKEPLCGALSDGRERDPRQGNHCDCPEGWEGINCNVCTTDKVCDSLVPTGRNGTCYRGGLTVFENHQMCNVTNRKILEQLKDQIPQVTFTCDKNHNDCDFQFWVDEIESFYCHLDECTFDQEFDYERNMTNYECKKIDCRCMPNEMLCGKDGSIDLTDLLKDEINGPATFKCTNGDCAFSEPVLDDLISAVFGDDSIFLSCSSGECLHYTFVPGFERPERPTNWVAFIIGLSAVAIFLLLTAVGVWYFAKGNSSSGYFKLDDDEAGKLMHEHIPATLIFENISYEVNKQKILNGVTGIVNPGQVMAIMGASGAGKTSLLDILAKRTKSGLVGGEIYVNGHVIPNSQYKKVIGYVDQEDTMIPTLTVYETVLYSALLRLPRTMSTAAKKFRVMETLQELGIDGIKDSKIGSAGSRSISGGERRRVAIACELVTSPSILFLDEPTSGLDAYNAYNVVESLVTLARDYNRTVVFTIHQPRSNIVALFDHLLLLAKGHVVFSGPQLRVQSHFKSIGHDCPPGFNIADYLVDLTMHATNAVVVTEEQAVGESTSVQAHNRPTPRRRSSLREEQEAALYTPHPSLVQSSAAGDSMDNPNAEWASELGSRQTRMRNERMLHNFNTSNVNAIVEAGEGSSTESSINGTDKSAVTPHLKQLIEAYEKSVVAVAVRDDIERALSRATNDEDPAVPLAPNNIKVVSSHERPHWFTQFRILADRTFKNLYRNPLLMFSHYTIAVVIALLCGGLFYKVENTIAGFQNRMGLFFFFEALLGFMCLTSLQVFSTERILFVRERANGYYSPITYFLSKVLFDIIPLRVVPPLMIGLISYHMIGLVDGTSELLKFLLVLILFNLTAAAVCLAIGVVFKDLSMANLLSSMVMLFSMLFAGLLLNKDSMSPYFAWLKYLSFFQYALEALLVNELIYLQLVEERFGLSIDVPGATILSTFGFNAKNYWSDVIKLSIMFGSFIVFAFVWLQFFVKERR
ncbi:ABC transporter [Umbelopsis sp. PMI_123]|nr:ABC transporter [Umbelopsis sp. PMI_123]